MVVEGRVGGQYSGVCSGESLVVLFRVVDPAIMDGSMMGPRSRPNKPNPFTWKFIFDFFFL